MTRELIRSVTGKQVDSLFQFLVEDNEVIQKEDLPVAYSDDYWEKRYTTRRDRIPVFLEKVGDVILRTGKYLNVIRQCGNFFFHVSLIRLTIIQNGRGPSYSPKS